MMAARVPVSAPIAGFALAGSLAVHLSGLLLRDPAPPVEVAGGGGNEIAAEGVALEELAAGVTAPVDQTAEENPVKTALTPVAQRVEAAEAVPSTVANSTDAQVVERPQAEPAEIPKTEPAEEPDDTSEISQPEMPAPQVATDVAPGARAAPVADAPSVAVEPAPPAETAMAPQTTTTNHPVSGSATAIAAAPVSPAVEATPVAPTETVAALPDQDGLQVSPRPPGRPPELETRAAEILAERQAEREQRQTRAREASDQERRRTSTQQQGNAQTNARRGNTGGQATGDASSSGAARQQAAGNAAASNYPGLVYQRIARQRLPRVSSRGTAQVTFSISAGGGLAGVSLTRSSGDGRLDAAALDIVRRAAPFPPPPTGAQRSFTIPVRAR